MEARIPTSSLVCRNAGQQFGPRVVFEGSDSTAAFLYITTPPLSFDALADLHFARTTTKKKRQFAQPSGRVSASPPRAPLPDRQEVRLRRYFSAAYKISRLGHQIIEILDCFALSIVFGLVLPTQNPAARAMLFGIAASGQICATKIRVPTLTIMLAATVRAAQHATFSFPLKSPIPALCSISVGQKR